MATTVTIIEVVGEQLDELSINGFAPVVTDPPPLLSLMKSLHMTVTAVSSVADVVTMMAAACEQLGELTGNACCCWCCLKTWDERKDLR